MNNEIWQQVGQPPLTGDNANVVSLTVHNGLLYAGTGSNGVWVLKEKTWSQVGGPQGLLGDAVYTRNITAYNGSLYAGTAVGVWKWDGQTWSMVGNLSNDSQIVVHNGMLYAGTGSGVYVWNGFMWSMLGNLPPTNTSCGLTSTNGVLYAIHPNKVWAWNGDIWSETGELSAAGYGVSSLATVDNKLFIGLMNQGVRILENNVWKPVTGKTPLPTLSGGAHVSCLLSFNGKLLAGVLGSDVWVWDQTDWSRLGAANGTMEEMPQINCLFDYHGIVYVGTFDGVWCYKSDQEDPLSEIFMDTSNHWAKDTIKKLVTNGFVSGYPDGCFRPDHPITRAEFVTILVKALKLEPVQGKVFMDIQNHWAKDAITTANACGILNGYQDGTFRPDELITREEMAVIMVKAKKLDFSFQEFSITDGKDISTWAKESVTIAIEHNMMKGYPDGTFKPKENATRAEAATVILNSIQ
ncbi:S-layer homology domain-containing protein [Desulforamulus ruminis]|nr:S-layer homology domain-containing protein [Desulforamulus ruminis]